MTREDPMREGNPGHGQERPAEGLSEFFTCLEEWERAGRISQGVVGILPRLVDASGRLLVGKERLGPLCSLIHASPLGRRRCRECYWRHSLAQQEGWEQPRACQAGLLYLWLPLGSGMAVVLGGFRPQGEKWSASSSLALELGLSPQEVSSAASATPGRTREELTVAARALKPVLNPLGEALLGQAAVLRQLGKLGELAVTRGHLLKPDPSTGLLSAEGFQARVQEEIARGEQVGTRLAVILFEIEPSAVETGAATSPPESAIEGAGQSVLKSLREPGTGLTGAPASVGRVGDTRLGIVLPDCDQHQAYQLAKSVHASLGKFFEGTSDASYHCHFGIAAFSRGIGADQLLRRAEEALAKAKEDNASPGQIFAAPPRRVAHSDRRVVVTGIGMVTPYGLGKDAFWKGALEGRSVIDRIACFDTSEFTSQIGGEIRDFDPLGFMDAKAVKRSGRSSHLAVAATNLAVEDASLNLKEEDPDRIGVVIGSAVGGLEFGEEQVAAYMQHGPKKVSPFLSIIVFAGAVSSEVSLHLGVKGPTITVSTGCSAGSDAIGYAFRTIREEKADMVFAGGTDAPLRPVIFASFCAINALSTRNDAPQKASRPFDLKRDGFVMSEGAAVLMLEELQHALRRGARIYGEVVGYAATGDAFHMTRPAPNGEEAARAMQLALEEARMKPEEVDYINAHGSSTPLNDKTETMAIKSVFGDHAYRLAVNSTKSLLGHPIGASGAIELGACLLSIQTGMLHPTINYEFFDPECDLDYVPNVARPARVKVAASNSFGFGGKNATLVVRAFEG